MSLCYATCLTYDSHLHRSIYSATPTKLFVYQVVVLYIIIYINSIEGSESPLHYMTACPKCYTFTEHITPLEVTPWSAKSQSDYITIDSITSVSPRTLKLGAWPLGSRFGI